MADSDILCAVCRDGTSVAPNEIVICDVCNQGYHQRCHKPKIGDEILEPDIPWTCRLCVFALGTKEGGAEKNGNIGRALKQMKIDFPYDLNDLHWDDSHQTNTEQKYCYCGGNGNYYSKMLQCCTCMQWFHEACIQALETPVLYGDHYYTFKCSVCGKGKEQLKRIIMKWSDMIALVINNLALQHQKRFFELSTEIVPFIQNNSNMLKMSEDIQKLTERELQDRISAVLKTNDNRFINGREVRKRAGQWALRMPFPFEKPLIFAPPFALQSSSSTPTSPVSSPTIPGKCSSIEPQLPQKVIPPAPLMYGACRKGASKWPVLNPNHKIKKMQQKNGRRSNSFSSSTGSVSCAASTASISSRCSQSNANKVVKQTVSKARIQTKSGAKRAKSSTKRPNKKLSQRNNSEDSSDSDMISLTEIESLDAVIPVPKNFEGSNNPFCDFEPNPLKSRLSVPSTVGPRLGAEPTKTSRISLKTEPKFGPNLSSETTNTDLKSPKMECFKESATENRFNILAQRVNPDGKVEYLLEWQN